MAACLANLAKCACEDIDIRRKRRAADDYLDVPGCVATGSAGCHPKYMSMAELMRVVANLPKDQQDKLAAFLLHLRRQHDTAWRAEMTRRIDDTDPARWLTLEDVKREFAAGGEQ